MAIDILDRFSCVTHDVYDVYFFGERIETKVTSNPSVVDSWISEIEHIHRQRLHHLAIGLDIEWRPNFGRQYDNRTAILQLCVGRKCLIIQLIHIPFIPESLPRFLENENYTFAGVGIWKDVEKLETDYGISVGNMLDLGALAAEEKGISELRNAGLKSLAKEVLGKEIAKPKKVTLSRWDHRWLTHKQIQYACVDAFVSFQIGKILNATR